MKAGSASSDSLYRLSTTLWHGTLPQAQWLAVDRRMSIAVNGLMVGGCR